MENEQIEALAVTMQKLKSCAKEIVEIVDGGQLVSDDLFDRTDESLKQARDLQKSCKGWFEKNGFTINSIDEMKEALQQYHEKDEAVRAHIKKVFQNFLLLYSEDETAQREIENEQKVIDSYSDATVNDLPGDEMSEEKIDAYDMLYKYVQKEGDIVPGKWLLQFAQPIIAATLGDKIGIRNGNHAEVGAKDGQDSSKDDQELKIDVPAGVRFLEEDEGLVIEKKEGSFPNGAKAFINDLKKKGIMTQVYRIFFEMSCGAIAEDRAKAINERAWDYLVAKGIVEKVYPPEQEEKAIYCLTKEGGGLINQQYCRDQLFDRKKIQTNELLGFSIEWAQLVSQVEFAASLFDIVRKENPAQISTTDFNCKGIRCFYCRKEINNSYKSVIFFPNIVSPATAAGLDEFFSDLKKGLRIEGEESRPIMFVLASDEEATKKYYSERKDFLHCQQLICNCDIKKLCQAAAQYFADENAENAFDFEKSVDGLVESDELDIVPVEVEKICERSDVAHEETVQSADTNEGGSKGDVIESGDETSSCAECINTKEAAKALLDADPTKDERLFLEFGERLVCEERFSAALLLFYALKAIAPRYEDAYNKLSLSCGETVNGKIQYKQSEIQTAFPDLQGANAFYGKVCADIRALLRPEATEYYNLTKDVKSMISNGAYSDQWEYCIGLKDVLHSFILFVSAYREGFDEKNLMLLGGEEQQNKKYEKVKKEAQNLAAAPYNAWQGQIFTELAREICGPGSEIYDALEIVINNDVAKKRIVEGVVGRFSVADAINDDKVLEYINEKWKEINGSKKNTLQGNLRQTNVNRLHARIEILREWLDLREVVYNKEKTRELDGHKRQIEKKLAIVEKCHIEDGIIGSLVKKVVRDTQNLLSGTWQASQWAGEFLRSDWIELSPETITPIVDEDICRIEGFELWRRVLKHIYYAKDEVRVAKDFEESDDFGFARLAAEYTNQEGYSLSNAGLAAEDAKRDEERKMNELRGDYELAYMYGRIDEAEKERLLPKLDEILEPVRARGNFGLCAKAQQALRENLGAIGERRYESLKERYDRFCQGKNIGDYPILKEIDSMLEERYLSLVEEYLDRAERGEVALPAKETVQKDYFVIFKEKEPKLREDELIRMTSSMEEVVKGLRLRDDNGKKRFFAIENEDSTPAFLRDAVDLISCFSRALNSRESARELLEKLGFTPAASSKNEESRIEHGRKRYPFYNIKLMPAEQNKLEYVHPIERFGTKLKGMSVICIREKKSAQGIDVLLKDNANKFESVVLILVDGAYSADERNEIPHKIASLGSTRTYVVLDRILLAYLAGIEQTSRLDAFLKCTLPYAELNPYQRSGAGAIPDEMFFGRRSERDSIVNFDQNTSLVCGGRQLGKTVLLRRAESICNNPEERRYACFIDAKTEAKPNDKDTLPIAVIKKCMEKMRAVIPAKLFPSGVTWRNFPAVISRLAENGISLALFIDEVDNFLKEDARNEYEVLNLLKAARDNNRGNFKFILAGLHNVSRQKHDNNSLVANIGDACVIKPFTPREAKELVETPLLYLGYRFPDEKLLTIILSHTNYYPGVLHYFCHRLVDELSKRRVGGGVYPPYIVKEEQVREVLRNADFSDFIKDRFKITIEVDEEKRYAKIATAVCLLYIDKGPGAYTIEEISNMCEMAPEMQGVSVGMCGNLLDEMTDLGVFSRGNRDGQKVYQFRKYAFFQYVGDNAPVKVYGEKYDKLLEYMGTDMLRTEKMR